jgi:isoleucyl-tRNA synthetase
MFKPVDPKQDFIALEHEIIKFWQENKILEKYLKKNEKSEKRWSFLDGPITANNPMGVHHAWGRTLKDLWQRYYTMKGYKQRYQNGFDCQGLWVEVEVEKELGFKNKKDIEEYGIDKFVNKCKERVIKYSAIQTEQSKRLGQWMDWDNSYYTMSDENNYTIWHFLKVCSDNGWIYKGTDSVPWCPRCGTAISQHEILTEEYKEVIHDSIFFTLPIASKGWEDHYLLVWTTTPWTIPANVAVAVDPEKEYAVVEDQNKKIIIMKSRVEKVFGNKAKIVKSVMGKDLLGLNYDAPFDNIKGILKQLDGQHQVVASDNMILPITEDEGTGMVHVATGAGSEDFNLGKKYNLPVISVIDEGANYLESMDYLAGKNAKKEPEIIFDLLKETDNGKFLYKIEPYKHRYPTCWRCKEELVWRNVAEWYIAMDRPTSKDDKRTFRQRMIEVAKKINWIPDWGLDRELDWLNNMHDWLISKKRYWGLALPIYECSKCGNFEVIGSKDELKNRAIEGWDKFDGNSPHRPWVDQVKIKCCECGQISSRVKDVGNPWLDAGIVPFSTLIDPETKKVSYLTDKKYWQEWFPPAFITECFPGQFKNWFYALIAMSAALEDTNSYQTLLGHGLVKDEKGEEMHKSKGNAIWFDEAAEKMGVDVMRFLYAGQNPVQNLNFGYTPAKEVLRSFVLMLWNCYSFFVTYSNLDNWSPDSGDKQIPVKDRPLLDRWILAKMNELVETTDKYLSQYNSYKAVEEIENFVNDLSTWYLRRSRKRRDDAFYQTMYNVLLNLCTLLAPFIPHISEEIYQNLRTNNSPISLHLTNWSESVEEYKNNDLLSGMISVREIVEKVHAIRAEKGIKVRQPLASLKLKTNSYKLTAEFLDIIADEVNVKEVIYDSKMSNDIELDINITQELRQEGLMREFVRQIQSLRKNANLTPSDKIEIYWQSDDNDWIVAINKFEKDILGQTLAQGISNNIESTENISDLKNIKISIKKV